MADITEAPVVDTTADIIETHPLVDNEELHAGVAERLRHSQEFGSALWDATKDYLQKMMSAVVSTTGASVISAIAETNGLPSV